MRSKTPLALMELLVMVLVFALAAAICVRMFVRSDQISRENEAVSYAALAAQDVAEELKSRRPAFAELYMEEDNWMHMDGIWILEANIDWMPMEPNVNENKDRYFLKVFEEREVIPGLIKVRIAVTDGDSTLFEIPVAWQEVSGHE